MRADKIRARSGYGGLETNAPFRVMTGAGDPGSRERTQDRPDRAGIEVYQSER